MKLSDLNTDRIMSNILIPVLLVTIKKCYKTDEN